MTTKRESILADIASSLAGTVQVSTRIYRSRVVPLSRGESPAIVIEPTSDTPEYSLRLDRLDWSLGVRISIIVRSSVPDQAADPIVEDVHSKMMNDLTAGGYAIDVEPGSTSFEQIDADQPAGVIGMDFVVKYRTLLTDLSSG
ncbi:MAG: hypothetical protein Unbinned4294contig1002_46 [Prokaryotic dsDNA virus sp.]|jgi:hypothetical protein|nr:MAG: hypothetical protein Unbinned4294contig1002_46 [Prokaryotic dsDNA virus sp.]|tara:strand:- start:24514 stop:24942 length:429 start_codon:yes stop_codon:yes gene_type:complete